jgi:hypothetical protein
MKKREEMNTFMREHLPRMPNFMEENSPRLVPQHRLGPEAPRASQLPTLLDAYFQGDVTQIHADVLSRPDHYTEQQREIVNLLRRKAPLPVGTRMQDLNDIVLSFFERTQQRKKREKLVQQAQKKLDVDPTVARKLQRHEDEKQKATFEGQEFPKAIRII